MIRRKKGEPEKNPGRAPSDTSSVSSDEIIDMEVEAEDVFPEINEDWSEQESQPEREKDEDTSKQEEQNKEEGWTKNKGKKRPAPKSAPKDVLTQQNRSFEKDLLQAMDLSMKYMDEAKEKAESDKADIQKAVEMSLKESKDDRRRHG